MTVETYLLFVGACVVLSLAPGPDMAYLLSRSIAQGKKAGLLAALGINIGAYVHAAAAVLGLSAILATSSLAYTIVKWAGACYLVYLGIQALRSNAAALKVSGSNKKPVKGTTILWQGFVSDVLNPKVALFFLAFLPQFVDPEAGNRTAQLLLLGATVNVVAIVINSLLVLFATRLTRRLRNSARITVWLNRVMGAVFISLGLRLAAEKS